jgi:hypothetical protein
LGNTTRIRQEACRIHTVTCLENALRTARHTGRLIRTHPGFVLTIVLSLALGIGANTTIFSVVHGVLVQPLPYPDADALAGIYNRLTISGQVYEDAALSPRMYAACRDDCRAFEHFGVWSSGAATVIHLASPSPSQPGSALGRTRRCRVASALPAGAPDEGEPVRIGTSLPPSPIRFPKERTLRHRPHRSSTARPSTPSSAVR